MTVAAPMVESSPLADVLSQLKKVKRGGSGYVALCPAHADDNPSLSISEGKDGRVLLNCHAGCQTAAIAAAIGIPMTALFPPSPNGKHDAPAPVVERAALVKTYDYVDADGTLLFQACRLVAPNGKKTFRQRRPDGSGNWIWNLETVRPVLYRLPEVAAAVESGRAIYIAEGEKDVDALVELGYAATTNPMGAGKWRDHYSDALAGAEVVIFADNDEPGRAHANEVAASLTSRKCTVRVVQLPGIPEKGDVSDWLEKGGDLDRLEEIISKTRIWTADPEATRNRWRLDELWDNESVMKPPPAVVPRLAWAGRITLLAAREKSGKSTLTGFVSAQVSQGRPFVGVDCAKGDVLVIGLEEFIGDTARRLRHFDADATRVHLVDRLIGDPQSRPQEVRSHMESVTPALVIIDSLSAYSAGAITDENNATQMTAVLKPLADLAHETGTAILVLHHANKASGKARGSTGIMANADVVCEFFAPEEKEDTDPTLRRMRSAGRVPVLPRWDFRFDGDTYVLADGTETPIEQRIIAVISSRPAISQRDVQDAIGGRWSDVQSAIGRMLATGQLLNISHGKAYKLVVPGEKVPQLGLG